MVHFLSFGIYQIVMSLSENNDGHWIWQVSKESRSYVITGKYLFFSQDQERLLELAKQEILTNNFHTSKVSIEPDNNDYVLCLYYEDDSRKQELANLYKKFENDGLRYRYWKSDLETYLGIYKDQNQHLKQVLDYLKKNKIEFMFDLEKHEIPILEARLIRNHDLIAVDHQKIDNKYLLRAVDHLKIWGLMVKIRGKYEFINSIDQLIDRPDRP